MDSLPIDPPIPAERMQAGSYSWRGGEGSQTDLNGDDRKPPERVQDPRYPENPNATCCDESEETTAIARSQPATGFVYMVNRFYEPETGRFTQADSLSFDPTQLTNAQNNRWTYCGSDPMNRSDPSGLLGPFVVPVAIAIFLFLAGLYYGLTAGSGGPLANLIAIAITQILGTARCSLGFGEAGPLFRLSLLEAFFFYQLVVIFGTNIPLIGLLLLVVGFFALAFGLGYGLGRFLSWLFADAGFEEKRDSGGMQSWRRRFLRINLELWFAKGARHNGHPEKLLWIMA